MSIRTIITAPLDTVDVDTLVRRHTSLPITCPACRGSGMADWLTCPLCGGLGEIDQCLRCYCWEPDGDSPCPPKGT